MKDAFVGFSRVVVAVHSDRNEIIAGIGEGDPINKVF
jgi:hypothetical protein